MGSGKYMAAEVGDNFAWMRDGSCVGMNPEWFSSEYEKYPKQRPHIDEICYHCPVQRECLAKGSDNEYGLWGGVFWDGTGKPDKDKNKHKTDKDWERIRNVV